MLDEPFITARNIVSLADARARRQGIAQPIAEPLRARLCCHCGAALGDGESEDECSSAGLSAVAAAMLRRAE